LKLNPNAIFIMLLLVLQVKKKAHNVRSKGKKSKQNGTPHQEQSPSQGHLKEGQHRSELHIDVKEHDAESGLGEHKVTNDVEEIGAGMMQETPETIPPSRIEELETRMEDREEEVKSDPLGEEEAEQDAEEEEEQDRDPSDSHDEEVEEVTREDSLDVFKYLRRFGDNMILHNYCWLLKNYAQNTAATNYYIIHMLQRICKDCLMEPMLYQVSLHSFSIPCF
jgi:timeless